jgi:muramidase (phage lysozyme)
MKAFLSMISHSEGTDKYGDDSGYNVIVGGSLFSDYSDHPRQLVHLTKTLRSTAAGRYQILSKYYDAYKKQLHLPDFGHESQDKIAIQLITECSAINDIESGNIKSAIAKCKSRWASFPASGYSQHENSADDLIAFYQESLTNLA